MYESLKLYYFDGCVYLLAWEIHRVMATSCTILVSSMTWEAGCVCKHTMMKWVFDWCAHYWSWKIVSEITAWNSPTVWRLDRHPQIKDNLCRYHLMIFKTAKGKKERWCQQESHPGPLAKATSALPLSHDPHPPTKRPCVRLHAAPPFFHSFPLPFHRSSVGSGRIVFDLPNSIRSSYRGGVPSIGLPMLWFRSHSFMIKHTLQSSHCEACIWGNIVTIYVIIASV